MLRVGEGRASRLLAGHRPWRKAGGRLHASGGGCSTQRPGRHLQGTASTVLVTYPMPGHTPPQAAHSPPAGRLQLQLLLPQSGQRLHRSRLPPPVAALRWVAGQAGAAAEGRRAAGTWRWCERASVTVPGDGWRNPCAQSIPSLIPQPAAHLVRVSRARVGVLCPCQLPLHRRLSGLAACGGWRDGRGGGGGVACRASQA